jgi:hypothetical protein
MTRTRWISLGIVVPLLSLPPLQAPANAAEGSARTAAGRLAGHDLTAGWGRVTPAYRRAIDRVVDSVRTSGRVAPTDSARTLVASLVRCATFEGQRYCLGQGWTDRTQSQVRARTTALVAREAARPSAILNTGDLSTLDALRQAARMSPEARAASERAELTQAARSVAKVWLIRHQVQGVPLPSGFFARHPEVRPATEASGARTLTPPQTSGRARQKSFSDYPAQAAILNKHHVSQQHRTYWCGPTSMQMIGWGWSGSKLPQRRWAQRLGTTTSGTAITSMVSVVNRYTGWDKPSYAGPYITLDIGHWHYRQWRLLMARHTVDYHAPVILHPVLLKQFFPYLDHDGSGHFQVGRGYRKQVGKPTLLGYFEPWNQQRFHPDEPYIPRVQWRSAYRSYRANLAHFQHNLGV